MKNANPITAAVLGLSAALLLGCAPQQTRQPLLINQQKAQTSEVRPTTCSQILSAIQRLEKAPSVDVINTSSGGQTMTFKSDKTERLETLREQARRQGCYSSGERSHDDGNNDNAESRDGPPTLRKRLSFDACFAKCRELTDRTAEQCFDACR